MPVTTEPGIFVARLGDDLVFLDVAADSYFCVLGEGLGAPGLDVFDALSAEQIDALVAEKVLVSSALSAGAAARTDRRQRRDLPPGRRPRRPAVRDCASFITAHRAARRLLRGDSLMPALDAAQRLVATSSPAHPDRIASAVARFEAMAIWLPRRGECLFNALALMHFLAYIGIATDWVFGVHLFPFRAHCWLASGDYVVGDASHRVLAFEPILTVTTGKR